MLQTDQTTSSRKPTSKPADECEDVGKVEWSIPNQKKKGTTNKNLVFFLTNLTQKTVQEVLAESSEYKSLSKAAQERAR